MTFFGVPRNNQAIRGHLAVEKFSNQFIEYIPSHQEPVIIQETSLWECQKVIPRDPQYVQLCQIVSCYVRVPYCSSLEEERLRKAHFAYGILIETRPLKKTIMTSYTWSGKTIHMTDSEVVICGSFV